LASLKGINIDYGNIDFDKFKFKNGNIEFNFKLDNIDSKNGVKRGRGWLLMMIGDAMTPFYPVLPPVWPRLTVDVIQFEVKFKVTVAFFEVTSHKIFRCSRIRYNLPLSSLSVRILMTSHIFDPSLPSCQSI